jgi:uncharacterized iron-regulated membrane protein
VIKVILRPGAGSHAPRMSLVDPSLLQPLPAADVSHHLGAALNRSERIGFWLYVAMGVFCTAILLGAAASAFLA